MKQASLLREKVKSTDKKYIKYRIVAPGRAATRCSEWISKWYGLKNIEDIPNILNIIDTFTRAVLYWSVGYQMKQPTD